jgi:ATP adenylyltransferase/5',5'''-P-1,P-4-tetraphosphate phosphorylase II
MEIKIKLLQFLGKLETNLESILKKPNLKVETEYSDIAKIKKKINSKYSQANPEHVVKSQITDEFFEQNGIKYLIKYLKIDKTKNKPVLINQKQYTDPFAPPIFDDVLISENFFGLNEHRLIFTKFPLFKEQLLLVSREFKSQYEHLSFENLRDTILLINSIDGCAFFNGGEKSGASQPRKHLQALPYKSFPNKDKNFGIFNFIKDKNNLGELNFWFDLVKIKEIGKFYEINIFKEENIEHILFKFSRKMIELLKDNTKANITGEICLYLYEIMSEYLGLFNYDEENNGKRSEKIFRDFTFLITQDFMLLVKRKEHDIFINENYKEKNEIINLNSIAFFFVIVSRSPEQIKDLKNCNIIHDVYTKL